MGYQGSIFGRMELATVRILGIIQTVLVHDKAQLHHHLYVITTIVSQDLIMAAQVEEHISHLTQCGTVKAAVAVTIVALNPTCHGSTVRYH